MKGRKVNEKVIYLVSFALASNVVAELDKIEEELEVLAFHFSCLGARKQDHQSDSY